MAGVYAHRGASAEYPENTLAAFRRAIDLGVEGMELDVHLSADGVPIVIHDETVDRTTEGSGAVDQMTVSQLQELNAGQGEKIPTLGQVLDLVGDRLHVDIEVKANEAGEAVLQELHDRNTRWLISSFDWDVLHYVRTVNADAVLWPLTTRVTDEAIEVAKALKASALAILHNELDRDKAARIKEHGLDFWVWTVNDPERARTYAGWGAIGICTDDPAAIQRALRERSPRA